MKMFTSFGEYEKWTETFENTSDYEGIPVGIDDGWKVAVDMFTACKKYKTALRRFEKTFKELNDQISGWVEYMNESCENGCFGEVNGWKPAWTTDTAEIREFAKGGTYSWGVEETLEGYWYIYLNISGIYAARERKVKNADSPKALSAECHAGA